jgi:hypothetical protein
MKKVVLIATLLLGVAPVSSQDQAKLIPSLVITRPPPREQLTISTGFGDTVLSQVADGGGWQTTITLVNLRPTPTTFSIICYGDNGGSQAFPWTGLGAYSAVYGSLVGYGTLEAVTTGTASATSEGWCNVTSPGSGPNPSTQAKNDVGAFAVFSYAPTGQQVSVPATSFFVGDTDDSLILAYDNTSGYSYGVALVDSNVYPYVGQPNDTVNVYIADQSANPIATDSFQMAPGSHLSFMLADKYPAIANTRGTVTFTIHTSTGIPTLAGLGIRAAPWGALTSVGMIEPTTY